MATEDYIQEVIQGLKNHYFGSKIEEDVKGYLSWHIKMDREKGITRIMQPHLNRDRKGVEMPSLHSTT